jgi:hypothetical protein
MIPTYTLAQIRNGTGFPRGAQFVMVSDRSQVPEPREWGWQGDPRADLDDREETPAPEGLSLFAHWSTAHEGINVEMDVPDDSMPLTIHVNDHIAFRRGAVDANIDTDDDTLAGSPYFGA